MLMIGSDGRSFGCAASAPAEKSEFTRVDKVLQYAFQMIRDPCRGKDLIPFFKCFEYQKMLLVGLSNPSGDQRRYVPVSIKMIKDILIGLDDL